MTATWKEALAYWNEVFNTGKYKIPKKGTPEYDEIQEFVKDGIPASFKTKKVQPKEAKEAKESKPRKERKKKAVDPKMIISELKHNESHSESIYIRVDAELVPKFEIDWTAKTDDVVADEVLE